MNNRACTYLSAASKLIMDIANALCADNNFRLDAIIFYTDKKVVTFVDDITTIFLIEYW